MHEGFDERDLFLSRPTLNVGGVNALVLLERLVDPRYEQQVAQTRLDDGCAREKRIGNRITNAAEAELVSRVLLGKQRNRLPHTLPLRRGVVHP